MADDAGFSTISISSRRGPYEEEREVESLLVRPPAAGDRIKAFLRRHGFFMVFLATLVLVVVLVIAVAVPMSLSSDDEHGSDKPPAFDSPLARAKYLQQHSPLVDGHNDLPWALRQMLNNNLTAINLDQVQSDLMTDLPRLREGLVGAQFWSVYVTCGQEAYNGSRAVQATMEQIDVVYRLIERYPKDLKLALTANDLVEGFKEGKIASLIGMEGGHSINNSLSTLRMFYRLGARYMTLTWACTLDWVDSANGPFLHNGLTAFGEQVVREMNRLGMLVDISHVSPAVMHAAINVSAAPIIFSHSNARALCDHIRNVPDDVLDRIPANGGMVMVVFYPEFVRLENPRNVTIKDVVNHIDYIKNRIGVDHVGLGSDFDGVSYMPTDLGNVSRFVDITIELIDRGYTDEEIKKVLGLNTIRVMRQAEAVAARLQKTTRPSDAVCC